MTKSIFAKCVAALVFGMLFGAPHSFAASNQQSSAGLDYEFETSPFMLHTAYRSINKLDNDNAPDGAYGPVNERWDQTHQGKWYVELQRNGGDLVDGGVATGNTAAVARGIKILRWGYEQQQPNGGFDCPDPFHSTSFFVESTAYALLLLEQSNLAPQFQRDIDYLTPRVHKAALWMIRPEVESVGRAKNMPYTHRRYLVGAALGETGVLCSDPRLINESESFVREGIGLQDASGYNPEKGGYDSSYDAVGLWYAERYYSYVATGELKRQLYQMLKKGVAWEASRITPDGQVITTGNSRVMGPTPEHDRTGKFKKPAVGQIFRTFAYWSVISGNSSYLNLAVQVAAGNNMVADNVD